MLNGLRFFFHRVPRINFFAEHIDYSRIEYQPKIFVAYKQTIRGEKAAY